MENPFNHSADYLEYLDNLPSSFYLKILENIYLGIYVSDKDGRTLYANPAITRHYGKKPEELVTYSNWGIWQGIVSPPAYKEILEKKRTLFYRQMHFFSKEVLTTIAIPVLDRKEDIELLIGITQDNIIKFDRSYEEIYTHPQHDRKSSFKDIIGESKTYLQELITLRRAAKSKTSILILGESGTGKSLAAHYVHNCSNRKNQPFLEINCAAIPENLLESELFGYVPHAFTGANPKGKKGLFQLANHGTLFLDEIGDLPLSLQSKILFVLETGKFLPIGSEKYIEVDVRIISATNQDLEKLTSEKKFRDDLYWRINAITSIIPSLRERKDDIIPLAYHFLNQNNLENGTNKKMDPLFISYLMQYDWPGNVRELKNVIQRCYILSPGYNISPDKIPDKIKQKGAPIGYNPEGTFDEMIQAYERDIIRECYKQEKTITKVQKKLGLSQNKAYRLIKKYCADLHP